MDQRFTFAAPETTGSIFVGGIPQPPIRTFAESGFGRINLQSSAASAEVDVYTGSGIIFSSGFGGEAITIDLPAFQERIYNFLVLHKKDLSQILAISPHISSWVEILFPVLRNWDLQKASLFIPQYLVKQIQFIMFPTIKVRYTSSPVVLQENLFPENSLRSKQIWLFLVLDLNVPRLQKSSSVLYSHSEDHLLQKSSRLQSNQKYRLLFLEMLQRDLFQIIRAKLVLEHSVVLQNLSLSISRKRTSSQFVVDILLSTTKSEVKDVNASVQRNCCTSYHQEHFGSGTLHLSGESVARFTANEVGTGFISTLSGAAESVTINPSEDTALFEFSGIASIRSAVSEVKFVKTSIFNEPVRVYVIKDYVARGGTLDLSGDGLIKISLLHIGSGSVSTFSGAAESTTVVPGDLYSLFDVRGIAATRKISVYGYYGDDADPGTSGSLFAVGGAAESRAIVTTTEGIFNISGTAAEAFAVPFAGRGNLFGLVSKEERRTFAYHPEGGFTVSGEVEDAHVRDYTGSGSVFSLNSAEESLSRFVPQHLQYSKLLAMQLSELLQESLVEEIYTPLEMLENPEQFLLPQESLENSSVLREEKLPEQNLVLVPQQFLDLVQSPLSRHLIQVPPTHLYLVKQSTELQLLKQDLPPRRSEVRQRSSQLKHSQPQFQSRFLAMLSSISLLRTQVLVLSSYSARAKKLDHLAHMYPKEASSS